MNHIAIAVLVSLVATSTSAFSATVDVDYPKLRDSELGRVLIGCIWAAEAEGSTAPSEAANGCTRILVSWDGPKAPPVVRYRGVPAQAVIDRLAAKPEGAAIDSPIGPAWPANQKGFLVAKVADDEVVMVTVKMMPTLVMPEWPEQRDRVISFSGPASHLKLGDLQDNLSSFDFVWEPSGVLELLATANSKTDAKSVMRYISLRRPLLDIAAGVGVEKAEFPAKLLSGASFTRSGAKITVKSSLNEDMRGEAVAFLVKTINKQMRKYN
ncbi:MAG: hypothetical protein H0W72_07605 [Planctomycetes bacterium]|nr:hypothetical protein [Planctomycetota bacterium]